MPTKPKRKPDRFAKGTEVPVSRSKEEIDRLLSRAGAHQIAAGSDRHTERGFVQFTLDGRMFRLIADHSRQPGRANELEQREREAWRALAFIVKGRLLAIATGQTTAEKEFLANLVLANNSTVGDELAPRIAEMYATGNMPRLLPA